jgi:hypothetical protein
MRVQPVSGLLSRRACLGAASLAAAAACLPLPSPSHAQSTGPADTGALDASNAVVVALAATASFVGMTWDLQRLQTDAGRATIASAIDRLIAAGGTALAAAAALGDADRPYLRIGLPKSDAETIHAIASRFARSLTTVTPPADLTAIRDGAAGARATLSAKPDGLGLAAMTLLPLCFVAEFVSMVRLSADPAAVRTVIEAYNSWVGVAKSQVDGAIMLRRQIAETDHDQPLIRLAQSHLGRRLELQNYLLKGDQSEKKIVDPCVIFATSSLKIPADNRGGVTVPVDGLKAVPSQFTPNVVVGHSRIRVVDDNRFGTRLIRFDPGIGGNFPLSSRFFLWPGISGGYCYVAGSNTELSAQDAFAKANAIDGVKEDKTIRDKIVAAVRNANACRIEIATTAKALAVANTVATMLTSYLGAS